jgi:hypothetical protein
LRPDLKTTLLIEPQIGSESVFHLCHLWFQNSDLGILSHRLPFGKSIFTPLVVVRPGILKAG